MPGWVHTSSLGSRSVVLVTAAQGAITAPITKALLGAIVTGLQDAKYLTAQAIFTYGSGGTTAKFWLQTSFDGGVTWADIMSFAFTTASLTKLSSVKVNTALAAGVAPTNGTLTDNTILDGLIGDQLQIIGTTTGTYATSSIAVAVSAKG